MTVFINQGDDHLEPRQAIKRGLSYFNQQLQQWQREQGIVTDDPTYLAWAAQWVADNEVNAGNNLFNHQLAAYRKANARLAQYRVADGRAKVTEEVETGETVVVLPAIDPLPAEVEQPVYNEDGEQTGTEMVANPAIVQDETERAYAMGVIASLPTAVKEFY